MDIDLHRIPIREVVRDYSDDGEGGVRGYEGKLNIRPPYQREARGEFWAPLWAPRAARRPGVASPSG
mgnify:CR=1